MICVLTKWPKVLFPSNLTAFDFETAGWPLAAPVYEMFIAHLCVCVCVWAIMFFYLALHVRFLLSDQVKKERTFTLRYPSVCLSHANQNRPSHVLFIYLFIYYTRYIMWFNPVAFFSLSLCVCVFVCKMSMQSSQKEKDRNKKKEKKMKMKMKKGHKSKD